jgi:hypothetical protein
VVSGRNRTRRQAIIELGGGLLSVGLLGMSPPISRSRRQKRPNVFFILSNDHRSDALGCAGHPVV